MTIYRVKDLRQVSHTWWRKITLSYVPGPRNQLLDEVGKNLLDCFRANGHQVHEVPGKSTDVILTTALFGKPIRWREALLFTARRRYNMDHTPTIFTLVHATREAFQTAIERFNHILNKYPPDPKDYAFPGLAAEAYKTLYEQGKRGGAMLALLRMVQTQAMSIRVILILGEDYPLEAYTFDLVGAHPRIDAANREYFYQDIVGRIVTAVSTHEITAHKVIDEPLSWEIWASLSTPQAMRRAGIELGKRQFFTEMVRVTNLAAVPAVPDAISSQYSEGCFATWEPQINGLITTVTGSARPVDKDNLTDDELAIIVGVKPEGDGALVRHVTGKRNDPPSSEAVELVEMDEGLPRIKLSTGEVVPVTRSKLHGHRGVRAYHPDWVEHVYLDEPYYYYPVSCSTEAQARAIKAAFSRSEALRDPGDQRQVVFTVLPGHGIVIVEKWSEEKVPFQVIWEYMDSGYIEIDNFVPQGLIAYERESDGMMRLRLLNGIRS